ncbi:MAG: VWA domain-containing protein [Deltaproteobacteria bacterium]|uniref:VWA domain-containing protein n=1 Tax=Candidatus Zymogenus saltonus TaxID=2844893 RepID=A0A9D8KEH6_9DELT|nr:VWA domain-containing protein [Candidatus Zymogenus saltonus]
MTLSQLNLKDYPTITAYLSITDPDDRPINLIDIKDLTVTEEEKPVGDLKIIEADPVTDPLSVVLAIDISGSMAGKPLEKAKNAAEAFVNLLEVGDKAAIVTFDQDVYQDMPLTDDKTALVNTIRGLKYKGDTALYQAIIDSADVLKDAPDGRRIVIILTDGRNDKANSTSTKEDSVSAAGVGRAVVITVGLGNEINADVLKYIAEETGGRFFFAPKPEDLKEIYELISDQIHAQYRLSFTSPFPERPDRVVLFHTIDVGLRYGGEKISGTREFLASTNPPPNTGILLDYQKKNVAESEWQAILYTLIAIAFVLLVVILLVLILKAVKARK